MRFQPDVRESQSQLSRQFPGTPISTIASPPDETKGPSKGIHILHILPKFSLISRLDDHRRVKVVKVLLAQGLQAYREALVYSLHCVLYLGLPRTYFYRISYGLLPPTAARVGEMSTFSASREASQTYSLFNTSPNDFALECRWTRFIERCRQEWLYLLAIFPMLA